MSKITFPQYIAETNTTRPEGEDPIDPAKAVDKMIHDLGHFKDGPQVYETYSDCAGNLGIRFAYKEKDEWRQVIRRLRQEQVTAQLLDAAADVVAELLLGPAPSKG